MDAHPAPSAAAPSETPPRLTTCRAVLTHHWLVRRRGGENVLAALAAILPQAEIYTLLADPDGIGPGWPPIHTSWLQRVPGARRHYPKLLPLLPAAFRSLRLPPADLVLCSDAMLAKAMPPHPGSRVVCYCHSPPRYAWDDQIAQQYAASLPAALRPLFRRALRRVRDVDLAAARRVDQFIANSAHVADRIRRWYARDALVVHPPVEVPPDAPPANGHRGDHYLCVGHHVPYKRLDLAVAACGELGRRLVIIGDGPDVRRLRRRRPPHIMLRGWVSRAELARAYREARSLLFPGEEDFGIVPVEAQAHGCPVIAYGLGGAVETVRDGETGVLFDRQTVADVIAAIQRSESLAFEPGALWMHARRFGSERFAREMTAILDRQLSNRNH